MALKTGVARTLRLLANENLGTSVLVPRSEKQSLRTTTAALHVAAKDIGGDGSWIKAVSMNTGTRVTKIEEPPEPVEYYAVRATPEERKVLLELFLSPSPVSLSALLELASWAPREKLLAFIKSQQKEKAHHD